MVAITTASVLFLLCVAASVMFIGRARRNLTVEQKAAIFDASAGRGPWPLVILALLMAAFALASTYGHHNRWLLTGFFTAVFPVVIAPSVGHLRRLSRSGLPPAYIRTFWLGMWVLWVGALLMFATVGFTLWRFSPR